MFIGHFGLGFAAKKAVPRISLAMLFVAAQLADLIWPVLVAVGVERVRIDPGNTAFTPLDFVSYPYSHSLGTLVLWGLALGVTYRVAARRNGRTIAVLAMLVISHFLLDWITHRADLPLYPGGPKVGLGLWNHVAATVVVETALFATGVWIYATATRPRDNPGRWGFLSLVGALYVLYVINFFSPPPPSVLALSIAALAGAAVILVWSWWVDLHRTV
jgi:hypothetical protein